ncbi:MAG: F0F1 ATP synthase subunit A [Planctomycetes bacterium]|nr:F0F1 ATP synthase subunit A [Planctomycetota bacterium]
MIQAQITMNMILPSMNPLDHIASKVLYRNDYFVFTNHMFMISLATVLLLALLPLVVGRRVLVRRGFGNAIEAICVYLREEVVRPFLKDKTDKYVGLLWTMFFFILTLNLLGMVPLEKIVFLFTSVENNHLGGTATANIWVTGSLAVISFLLFHYAGIRENGFVGYFKNFAPKVPIFIMPFIYLMETLSSFVRMFSLAIRLFANMLAGHVLLGTLLMLIILFQDSPFGSAVGVGSTIFRVMMSLMELFVAFLQAYIFTFLTTIFIGLAVHQDH